MAYSARPLSTDELTKLVYQPAHGFTVGECVTYRLSLLEYVRTLADTPAHAQCPLIVSIVIDADNFYVTQNGYVTGIDYLALSGSDFVVGTQYYLDPVNPGLMTTTVPSTLGQIINPVFVADTTTSGYFATFPGAEIVNPVLSSWVTVSGDTNMVYNIGYFVNSAGNVNLTLPATIEAGQTIQIASISTGGFIIKQNAGQSINFIQSTTTVGAGGQIELDATLGVKSGSLEIICTLDDDNFKVIKSTGNFIIT